MSKSRALYQLEVTLQEIQTAVWRSIQVWEDATLAQLYDVLQVVAQVGTPFIYLYDFGDTLTA